MKEWIYKKCINLYGAEHVGYVRCSAVIAVWPHLSGILTSNYTKENVRIGIVDYFLLHLANIKCDTGDEDEKTEHLLAHVNWFQDHPCKFNLGNGTILSATVPQIPTCSTFMPVS